MDKKNFAFGKINFILLAVSMLVVIIGLVLMSGGGTDDGTYNPEIFNAMRTKVAPVVTFAGFIAMIYAVLRKPKDE